MHFFAIVQVPLFNSVLSEYFIKYLWVFFGLALLNVAHVLSERLTFFDPLIYFGQNIVFPLTCLDFFSLQGLISLLDRIDEKGDIADIFGRTFLEMASQYKLNMLHHISIKFFGWDFFGPLPIFNTSAFIQLVLALEFPTNLK